MQFVVNGKPASFDAPLTIAELLARLELDVRQVAVEVNEALVPRGQHAERALAEGDRVEIVTFVGGG